MNIAQKVVRDSSFPDRWAILFEDCTITYRELDAGRNQVVSALIANVHYLSGMQAPAGVS
jgi:hypothetical protein